MGGALDDLHSGRDPRIAAADQCSTASTPPSDACRPSHLGRPYYPGDEEGLFGLVYQDGEFTRRCHGWSDNMSALKAIFMAPVNQAKYEGFRTLLDPGREIQLRAQVGKELKQICQKPGGAK